MKYYLSGPIDSDCPLPPFDRRLMFDRTEAYMKLYLPQFEPVNPLRVGACEPEDCNLNERKENGDYRHSWQCYLKHDIQAMLDCEGIVLLPYWYLSKGAMFEYSIASQLGMGVLTADLQGRVIL